MFPTLIVHALGRLLRGRRFPGLHRRAEARAHGVQGPDHGRRVHVRMPTAAGLVRRT